MNSYKKSLIKPWFDKQDRYERRNGRVSRWTINQVKRLIRELNERKLDIEVAEKVFGRKVEILEFIEYLDYGGDVYYPELAFKVKQPENPEFVKEIHKEDPTFPDFYYEEIKLPNYSTDLKEAWTIIDHFSPDDIGYELKIEQEINEGFAGINITFNGKSGSYETSSVSKAICMVVLNGEKTSS